MKIDREKYNQIIDEVYENYVKKMNDDFIKSDISLPPAYYPVDKEVFIEKIKTDDEFANTWGLKIEKKEYTLVNGEFIKDINVYHIPKTSTEYIETKFIVLPTGDIENE